MPISLIIAIINSMLKDFFVSNFALICISIAMIFICIQNLKTNRKQAIFSLVIVGTALLLSVLLLFEDLSCELWINIPLATFFAFLGYTIRPVCLYFFLAIAQRLKAIKWPFRVPLAVNVVVYALALFVNVPQLSHLIYYYEFNHELGILVFQRGTTVLNFFSHAIGLFYLAYLLIVSFKQLNNKHKTDFFVIITCVVFVIAAVVLESLQLARYLLNTVIVISCLFFYFFLYTQYIRKDALTGLFDRKTFYSDIAKADRRINGILQIDMNGLKVLNDSRGHEAGDEALKTIGEIIDKCTPNNMYGYRVGGDEFSVICLNSTDEQIIKTVEKIQKEMAKTEYHISIGYAFNEERDADVQELIRAADKEMYPDKEHYYLTSGIDRRKK